MARRQLLVCTRYVLARCRLAGNKPSPVVGSCLFSLQRASQEHSCLQAVRLEHLSADDLLQIVRNKGPLCVSAATVLASRDISAAAVASRQSRSTCVRFDSPYCCLPLFMVDNIATLDGLRAGPRHDALTTLLLSMTVLPSSWQQHILCRLCSGLQAAVSERGASLGYRQLYYG